MYLSRSKIKIKWKYFSTSIPEVYIHTLPKMYLVTFFYFRILLSSSLNPDAVKAHQRSSTSNVLKVYTSCRMSRKRHAANTRVPIPVLYEHQITFRCYLLLVQCKKCIKQILDDITVKFKISHRNRRISATDHHSSPDATCVLHVRAAACCRSCWCLMWFGSEAAAPCCRPLTPRPKEEREDKERRRGEE